MTISKLPNLWLNRETARAQGLLLQQSSKLVYDPSRVHWNYRHALWIGAFTLALGAFTTRLLSPGWAFLVVLLLALSAGVFLPWIVDSQLLLLNRILRSYSHESQDAPLPEFAEGPMADVGHAANALRAQLTSRFAEIKREQERLQVVLNEMTEGVALLQDGSIQVANPSFGALLGTDRTLIRSRLVEVTRIPELAEALWTATTEKRSIERDIFTGTRALRVSIHPLANAAKQALMVLLDVTESRRLEQLRREFVTNASHELRTPVAAVLGVAETLASGAAEDPKARASFVDILVRHSKRLSHLTQDLLDLARLESGCRPERENVVLATAFQNISQLIEPLALHKGVTLSVTLSPDLVCVAERAAVEQIFTNLIQNAIQYTPAGGHINIAGQRSGNIVEFWVKDTGPGIPQAHQARLFERFYRVDQARSRELGGTGLGLAIVKHLALAYDGDVTLRSEEGHGAQFTVRFPAGKGIG